jgi:S1-C subfamily serine protease
VDVVRGDLLDLVLLVLAVGFAVSGYRQGFVVGALSFIGFVGGAVLGAEFGPAISRAIAGGQTQQDVIAVVLLVVFAIVGQFVFSAIGAYARQSMVSQSSTVIDSIGGAGVSVLSMLLIVWAMASALNASSFAGVVNQIQDSAVLTTMDRVMPAQAKTMFGQFRQLLANGPFPQVFSGIGADHLFAISAPDPAVLTSPGYEAARSRVLKIQGTALSCDRDIEGSGFVFAPDHVMTNAHVVAGVDADQTVTTPDGKTYTKNVKVVLYDPQVDIAVLYVPGLDLTPLQFNYGAQVGDSAVVAGYPENDPFTQVPARIGGTQAATGADIYDTGSVTRDIYQIRANVEPGNSGGPLLSPSGTVDGVTFAADVGTPDIGFSLTASEVEPDAKDGAAQTFPVSTEGCD